MVKNSVLLGIGAGSIVGIAALLFFSFSPGSISFEPYQLSVDAFKDSQSLFVMARVSIQNVGSQPLTNVTVDYGSGKKDFLGTLKPGQKVIVSPPENNQLDFVVVSANENIWINKAYREAPKMVGMMGS